MIEGMRPALNLGSHFAFVFVYLGYQMLLIVFPVCMVVLRIGRKHVKLYHVFFSFRERNTPFMSVKFYTIFFFLSLLLNMSLE